MTKTAQNMALAIRIVRQLRTRPTHWISDVGRGPIEKSGNMVSIRRSARGLSIGLDSGAKVAWTIPAAVARLVCQWTMISADRPRIHVHFSECFPILSGFVKRDDRPVRFNTWSDVAPISE